MTGVNTAPPTMDITSSEPPILVFGPSPFKPIAKIVGNISDMKKLVRNTHHNPNQPGNSTPNETSTMFAIQNAPINLLGAIVRMRYEDANLPTPNAASVPVRK